MKKILMFTGAILGITLLCNTKALAYDGNYNPVSVKNEQTYEETTDVQRNSLKRTMSVIDLFSESLWLV